ncbi:hypothetical protein PENTCL1PPCAC_2521, partial [Pristionchus entomophagus]
LPHPLILMRFSLLLGLLIGVATWKGHCVQCTPFSAVTSRGGFSGGGRGSSGGRSSSSSSHSSPSSSSSRAGGTPRSASYSPSYHPSAISHSSFTSSLLTSMAISSMFHHSMSPYSHRYVYVVQEEKAPFRTNVTESRDYYFGEENIPVDNCTHVTPGMNDTTGDDTIDLILAQTFLSENSTMNSSLCNVCTYKIEENSTDEWAQIEFKDGSRPSTLAWKCKIHEVCCGFDCCEERPEGELKWWMIVLISVCSAIAVLLIIKCLVSLRKWCSSSSCRAKELSHGPAPPLTKLDHPPPPPPPPSAPLPPDSRSYNLSAPSKARPASAASLSGVQPNIPKKQRKYEQH